MEGRRRLLTIRYEQQLALERDLRERYIDRMVDSVAKDYPRQFDAMGSSGTRDLVGRAIKKGHANHVDTQGGVAVLLQLMIEFGEEFELSPDKAWADEVLAHASLPPQLRVRLMRDRMRARSHGRVVTRFTG
jgi:hypothetical protein